MLKTPQKLIKGAYELVRGNSEIAQKLRTEFPVSDHGGFLVFTETGYSNEYRILNVHTVLGCRYTGYRILADLERNEVGWLKFIVD